MVNKIKLVIVLFLVVLCTTIAMARPNVTVVNDGIGHGTVDFSSADTADISSRVYSSIPVALNGRKTIFVSATTSASGATLKVGLAVGTYDPNSNRWTTGPFWVQSGTMTADGTIKSNGNYVVPGVELTTGGWTHFQVHLDSLSTGSCTVGWSAY